MMKPLDQLYPEVAQILVTQEQSMGSVISILSGHIEKLQDVNAAQSRQVAVLLASMNNQQEHIQRLEKEAQSLREEIVSVRQVGLNLASSINDTEQRLEASMTEKVLQCKRAEEESIRLQVDLLEKKFDYLSRVKMEIKDIEKRMDKNEQGIGDLKAGLELLAKNVGTDEIDSDHEEEEDETHEQAKEEEEDPTANAKLTFSKIWPSLELSQPLPPAATSQPIHEKPDTTPADAPQQPDTTPADAPQQPDTTPVESPPQPAITPADTPQQPATTPVDATQQELLPSSPESTPEQMVAAPVEVPVVSVSQEQPQHVEPVATPPPVSNPSPPAIPEPDKTEDIPPQTSSPPEPNALVPAQSAEIARPIPTLTRGKHIYGLGP